jgi:hypothetical protein
LVSGALQLEKAALSENVCRCRTYDVMESAKIHFNVIFSKGDRLDRTDIDRVIAEPGLGNALS